VLVQAAGCAAAAAADSVLCACACCPAARAGKLQANEVKRAIQLRDIVTSLGPAYIKLG
jgi:predicted unusual protein kinase regulating ubiquinone biosynthesis (AarF/ABC1/UbiB family)